MLIPPPIPSSLSLPSTVQDIRGHATQLSDANSLRATMRSQLKLAHKLGVHHADWSACVKVRGSAKSLTGPSLGRSERARRAHEQHERMWGSRTDSTADLIRYHLRSRLPPQATTDYLPYLYAILGCIEADDLLLKADPVFTWRMTLSTQALKKPHHKIALPSYHYELASTLLCHALCLSNNSASLVASLGSYEFSNTLSTTDLSKHDQVVQTAAEMLCRAAGLLAHLSEVVIPRWETAIGLDSLAKSRPVELTREVTMGLAKLCEADANLLAIRRLLSRSLSVAHSTTTPGPPLSSTHPSPSLLAKLHLHVHQLYDAARSLIKAPSSSSGGGGGGGGEISQALRTYLSQGRALALALSWKWLGVDCGELGGREKCGDAVGWLEMSRKELDEIQNGNKGLIGVIKRGKEGAKVRKGKVGEEVESVARFLNAYKKVNDSVHFMPVPSPSTLQLRVPAGRAALSAKVFTPPSPAFKSRSTYNGPMQVPPPPRALETEFGKLGIGTTGSVADSSDEEGEGEGTQGDYFGAGQYF